MANILVAGAGGYIGIPLCASLLERGHTVVALDRFFFGVKLLDPLTVNPNFRIVVEDIRNVTHDQLKGIDAVIDLAGLSNDASAEIDPELTRSINYDGGCHLARTAKEAGVKRYVYASSASVYGHGVKEELVETDDCRPQTIYAECKVRMEEFLHTLSSPDFEIVMFRNATVFGLAPRMRFDLAINIMTLRAWKERNIYIMGGGAQWRPFVHVSDVGRAMIHGVEEPAELVAGEVFNVGSSDMNYQIQQLAQFVVDIIPNVTVHRIPDEADKRTYSLSFAKIHQRLGYQPVYRVHEGIVEIKKALESSTTNGDDPTCYTLQWYRSLIDWEQRIAKLSLHGRML